MANPEVKSIICTFGDSQYPWEDVYILFMLPGFIIWLIGAIWCFKTNNIRGSVLLQVIGALEIALGGISAFIVAIKDLAYGAYEYGANDPVVIFGNIEFYAVFPIIGLIAHFILLAMTLIIAIRAKRNLKKIQPAF
jgi:hypothetical protein